MKKLSIFLLFFYLLSCVSSQPKHFVMEVGQYTKPDFKTYEFKCFGTVVALEKVLTTANCVTLFGDDIEMKENVVAEKRDGYTSMRL
jgi:hypothetical protein